MANELELTPESLSVKTPLKALEACQAKLRVPDSEHAPQHRLKKPVRGCYHLVRFIRGDRNLNVFGEFFRVPPGLQHEYVVATIYVKE
jgi:hypothetical protein